MANDTFGDSKSDTDFKYLLPWLIATVSTLGSLFFSEVMGLPPCVLCWYQRVCMYPLVIIFGVGIWQRDNSTRWYALPLAVAGTLVAIYHNLLYYGILSESLAPCSAGVSCTSRQIVWLGFITIPLLSLTAFILLTIVLVKSFRPKKGVTS